MHSEGVHPNDQQEVSDSQFLHCLSCMLFVLSFISQVLDEVIDYGIPLIVNPSMTTGLIEQYTITKSLSNMYNYLLVCLWSQAQVLIHAFLVQTRGKKHLGSWISSIRESLVSRRELLPLQLYGSDHSGELRVHNHKVSRALCLFSSLETMLERFLTVRVPSLVLLI